MAELRFETGGASWAMAEMRLFSMAGFGEPSCCCFCLMLRFPSGFKDSWWGNFGELAVRRSIGACIGAAFGCLSVRTGRLGDGRFSDG